MKINDANQWSLRMALDAVAVVAFFLAVYNAKKMGVKQYIAQFMLNTPTGTDPTNDLGKMLAKIELINRLEESNFTVFRQIRAGLSALLADLDLARGQLANATFLGMALRPHIIHVVGYSEASHAAGPQEVIASCRLVKPIYETFTGAFPNMVDDQRVQCYKK